MMITIGLSWECIKQPRCSFCYLADLALSSRVINELDSERDRRWNPYWTTKQELEKLIKNGDTICFEFNGYNLSLLADKWRWFPYNDVRVTLTMTTMPEVVSPIFCSFIAHEAISAVALSYDSEKVKDENEWLEKAKMIKEAGMQVSCNYLIEPYIGLAIPDSILGFADQLNLLSFKPTGRFSSVGLKKIRAAIEAYKTKLPVCIDNCLGLQLRLSKTCEAGKSFIHILPNGEIVDCCFSNKCFLWVQEESNKKEVQFGK